MITVIPNNRSFHRCFYRLYFSRYVLAIGRDSDESASKRFADWVNLGCLS